MSDRIDPRVLKGFRDFLPEEELERRRVLGILESSFRSFGFVPIDTPVLEYTEILLGKAGGETEKQVYRFDDHGGRDVAMRFDLTVPFARFMAQHRNDLALPFKRYHIAKVFRGENTQRGRYREFMQCDFDIVGTDSASADLEIILMIIRSLEALGLSAFHVRISNRAIFNRFLDYLGVAEHSEEILRTVDKLRKIGEEKTRDALAELTGAEAAADILAFVAGARADASANAQAHARAGTGEETPGAAPPHPAGDKTRGPAPSRPDAEEPPESAATPAARNAAVLEHLTALAGGAADDALRVAQILEHAEAIGIGDRIVLDPSITRGLDYYTGMVFETFLDTEEGIGSICSGGRYNDLASLYTKEQLPGVGASIGVDRLLAAVSETRAAVPSADVIVLYMDDSLLGRYHAIAEELRRAGLRCEVYPESRKLPAQFKFAERKGIPAAVICGPDEAAQDVVNVKNLATRESFDAVSVETAVEHVRRIVAEAEATGGAE